LDITPVDPIKEDLYFERFLNPFRKSPPDIDLDFGTSKRDDILNYIYKTYGEKNVAMISTHIKYSLRGAIRDVGKAKGLSEEEIVKITKFLPYEDLNLNELIEKYPECKVLPYKDPKFKEIYDLSLKISSFPKGFGIHCGGIVISPKDLNEYIALTISANGRIITQPDMYGVEDLGLLKLDILGNRSLDVLPYVLSKIDEKLPNLDEILKDEKTKGLIREGETIGCFYIESPAMRQLLKKLKVDDFPSLVIATSIIRPGVAESGMMQAYIRRHLGKEKPVYLLPEMEEILKETYGIMVYQEDVIKVANKIASLSLSEADAFRKAMSGKSRSHKEMEKALNLFIENALKKGYPKEAVKEIARQISSFAGYAFCKAHSAAFSTLSFKMAYLKSHFPEIFLSSVLNFGGGFYPPIVYIQEAKRLGIDVLPPFINSAEIDYKAGKNQIIVGFKAVKNLSKKTQEKILKERKEKKFNSFLDFYSRVMPEMAEVESLIKAGAFDQFGYKRKELFWLTNFGIKGDVLKFISKEVEKEILSKIPNLEEDEEERVFMEWDCLGFPLSAHPVKFVRNGFKVFAKDLKNYIGKRISIPALILVSKKIWVEKQKGWMKFLTLEDETNFFEGVIFPKNYERDAVLTKKMGPHIFEGIVKDDSGSLNLEIEKIIPIQLYNCYQIW
jgi:DNA-directed DNA polymerase III PolC